MNISEHGARTETADFLRIMQLQEETGDLSLRVPVDPFTDTGVIAARRIRNESARVFRIQDNVNLSRPHVGPTSYLPGRVSNTEKKLQ